jgi:hypothetical protein
MPKSHRRSARYDRLMAKIQAAQVGTREGRHATLEPLKEAYRTSGRTRIGSKARKAAEEKVAECELAHRTNPAQIRSNQLFDREMRLSRILATGWDALRNEVPRPKPVAEAERYDFEGWVKDWKVERDRKRTDRRAELKTALESGRQVRETLQSGVETVWPEGSPFVSGKTLGYLADHLEAREDAFGTTLEILPPAPAVLPREKTNRRKPTSTR